MDLFWLAQVTRSVGKSLLIKLFLDIEWPLPFDARPFTAKGEFEMSENSPRWQWSEKENQLFTKVAQRVRLTNLEQHYCSIEIDSFPSARQEEETFFKLVSQWKAEVGDKYRRRGDEFDDGENDFPDFKD
jgi:hypothetical protein